MRFIAQSEDTQSKQNRSRLFSQANLSPLETRTNPEGDNVTNPYCDATSFDCMSTYSVETRRKQKQIDRIRVFMAPRAKTNKFPELEPDKKHLAFVLITNQV